MVQNSDAGRAIASSSIFYTIRLSLGRSIGRSVGRSLSVLPSGGPGIHQAEACT